ncbi:hypothetical protein C7M84_023373, partial [Penaeus vannamei]
MWEVVTFDGAWVRNATAGGGDRKHRVFCSNPQYILELTEADDGAEGTCATISKKKRNTNPLTVSWLRLNVPISHEDLLQGEDCDPPPCLTRQYLVIPAHPSQTKRRSSFCGCSVRSSSDGGVRRGAQILDIAYESEDEVDHSIEDHLRAVFREAAGEANDVDAVKLQAMLEQLFPSAGFADSLDFTRSFLAMMDLDFSGTVNFYEFEALFSSLSRWWVYNSRKDEESGLLSGHSWGLGDALRDLGLQIPRRIRALVVVRYGDQQGHVAQDFLMAPAGSPSCWV